MIATLSSWWEQRRREREALQMFRRACLLDGNDLSHVRDEALLAGVAAVIAAMVASRQASSTAILAMLSAKLGIFSLHLLAPAMRSAGNFRVVEISTGSAGDDAAGAGRSGRDA